MTKARTEQMSAEPDQIQTTGSPRRIQLFDWNAMIGVLRLIRRERRQILAVAGIGTALALAFAMAWPSWYEVTVRILPSESRGFSMRGVDDVTAMVASQLLGTKSGSSTYMAALHSRVLQDRIIRRCALQKAYSKRYMEGARRELLDHTEIYEDRKTGVITIAVTGKNRELATAIGQAYVDELSVVLGDISTTAAHRQRIFLEERLKAVKQELDRATMEFGRYASQNRAFDVQQQGKAMLATASEIQLELIAAESELRGLQQIYTDENSRVMVIKGRIGELKQRLAQIGGTANSSESLPPMGNLTSLGAKYAELYRNVKVQEAVIETLTKQYELTKIEEAQESPGIQVVDPPEVPERPAGPPRFRIVLLGALFSTLAGLSWVLVRNGWKKTPSSDVRKQFVLELANTVSMRHFVRGQETWAGSDSKTMACAEAEDVVEPVASE